MFNIFGKKKDEPRIIAIISPNHSKAFLTIEEFAKTRKYRFVPIRSKRELKEAFSVVNSYDKIFVSFEENIPDELTEILRSLKVGEIYFIVNDDISNKDVTNLRSLNSNVIAFIRNSTISIEKIESALNLAPQNVEEKLLQKFTQQPQETPKEEIKETPKEEVKETPKEEVKEEENIDISAVIDEEFLKELTQKTIQQNVTQKEEPQVNAPKIQPLEQPKVPEYAVSSNIEYVPQGHLATVLFTSPTSHAGTTTLAYNTAYVYSIMNPKISVAILELAYPPRLQVLFRWAEVRNPLTGKTIPSMLALSKYWETKSENDLLKESITYENIRIVQAFSSLSDLNNDISILIKDLKFHANILFITLPNAFILKDFARVLASSDIIFEVFPYSQFMDDIFEYYLFHETLPKDKKIITIINKTSYALSKEEKAYYNLFPNIIEVPLEKVTANPKANKDNVLEYNVPLFVDQRRFPEAFDKIQHIISKITVR